MCDKINVCEETQWQTLLTFTDATWCRSVVLHTYDVNSLSWISDRPEAYIQLPATSAVHRFKQIRLEGDNSCYYADLPSSFWEYLQE